jgi:hypothetical protein
MGLMKKYIAKMQSGAPDYEAEVRQCLQPGEDFLGASFVSHAAYEMDTSVGRGGKKFLQAAVNSALEARKKSQHLSGDDNSLALSIPRDGQYLMAVVSNHRLSMWSFGQTAMETPPTEIVSFARSSVKSVVATGETDNYGHMTRFTFSDDSYADMKVTDSPTYAAFTSACQGLAS